MAIRVIDDSKLQDIAVAIQGKDGGGQMTVDQMPTRIAEIPTPVKKKDVNFYDWEGTLLFGYSVEEVQAMTSLPAPDTSSNYQSVDHDLLTFQKWTRNLTNIKTWVQNHSNQSLGVGAIYTTTDRQDHSFWNSPRLDTAKTISMQKHGTAFIENNAFASRYSLTQINIPDSVTSIGTQAFMNCKTLCDILLESKPTLASTNAFDGLPTNYRTYVPRADLSWFKTATNWSTIYAQGHIVAIGDYIEYLESIGYNVDEYKEVSA